MLFPTTIVGSFPQPDWLIDRSKLAGRFPPRVRARELWRIPEAYLEQAQEDATLVAIRGWGLFAQAANFDGANLRAANLEFARLSSASLHNAQLHAANL